MHTWRARHCGHAVEREDYGLPQRRLHQQRPTAGNRHQRDQAPPVDRLRDPGSDIGKYELDHLVELSGGGSSDIRNLWPEPDVLYSGPGSSLTHNDKDKVEQYLFHAGCAGKASLVAIQQAVSQNWTPAVAALHLPPIPAGYRG